MPTTNGAFKAWEVQWRYYYYHLPTRSRSPYSRGFRHYRYYKTEDAARQAANDLRRNERYHTSMWRSPALDWQGWRYRVERRKFKIYIPVVKPQPKVKPNIVSKILSVFTH